MLRVALFAFLILTGLAEAAVNPLAIYRLGDADPGATAGAVGNDPTAASVGSADLARTGEPTYSAEVAPFVESSLAMRFDGDDDRYEGALLTDAIDNFGVEAWVKSDGNTQLNSLLVYNGSTSTSGWGLFRVGADYGFLYGGIVLAGVAPLTTEWTHLALVRDGGTTRMFVNGEQRLEAGVAPLNPDGAFMIGGNPDLATEGFDGLIDEVRVFTFAPGQFSVDDLNLGNPPAEPGLPIPVDAPFALVLLALLILIPATVMLRRTA